MNCQFCGKEEALPFVCNYCGGTFCSDHRLPEGHNCAGDLSKKPVIIAPTSTFSWQGTTGTSTRTSRLKGIFSRMEIRDIVIAWLALGLAFYLSSNGGLGFALNLRGGSSGIRGAFLAFAVSLIAVGSGFVLHELSHKFIAERYGYWAEFRMWPTGIILALVTSLLGFIFAAPGATYISGTEISQAENGKISLAGPLMNVLVAILFLPFLLVGNGFAYAVARVGVSVNTFLALFNMLPIFPLDGSKVFAWSKTFWVLVFVPLGIVVVTGFLSF